MFIRASNDDKHARPGARRTHRPDECGSAQLTGTTRTVLVQGRHRIKSDCATSGRITYI
jgi:hypothetical protein